MASASCEVCCCQAMCARGRSESRGPAWILRDVAKHLQLPTPRGSVSWEPSIVPAHEQGCSLVGMRLRERSELIKIAVEHMLKDNWFLRQSLTSREGV